MGTQSFFLSTIYLGFLTNLTFYNLPDDITQLLNDRISHRKIENHTLAITEALERKSTISSMEASESCNIKT